MKAAAPEVIASIPLYARLQGEELQALAAVSRIRVYSRGEVLFEEGEPADDFHTIVRGRVKVFKLRPGGKELILTARS
jgi:CRP/FNR family transcriptional regulator